METNPKSCTTGIGPMRGAKGRQRRGGRRFRRSCRRHIAGPLLCVLILAAGCGLADDARELVSGAPEDSDFQRTLVIDLGHAEEDDIMRRTAPVVEDSAKSGHRVKILIASGGNSGSFPTVDLSDVGGGDLRRRASNELGREEEATENAEAVMQAIRAEFGTLAKADSPGAGSGIDLFGAIRRAATSPITPDQVVVITGGGVHRTAELDLLAGYGRVSDLFDDIPRVEAPETDVVVLGVGDFSGSGVVPSMAFTDAVVALWEAACATWRVRSCTLADDPAVLDDLETRAVSSATADPVTVGLGSSGSHRRAAARRHACSRHGDVACCPPGPRRWGGTRGGGRLLGRLLLALVGLAALAAMCGAGAGCASSDSTESGEVVPTGGGSVVGRPDLPQAETLHGEIPGIEPLDIAADDAGGASMPGIASDAVAVPVPPASEPAPAPASEPAPAPASEPAPAPASEPAPAPASEPAPAPESEPPTAPGPASTTVADNDGLGEPRRIECAGFRVQDVLFESGTATLAPSAAESFTALVERIPRGAEVSIVGHADNRPISIGNQELSERRAEAVAQALVDASLNASAISEIVGMGDSRLRDRFPACRGKRAPQPCPFPRAPWFRRALSPLAHPLDSPTACSPASPSGTKTSPGKAAMLDS